MSKKEKKGNVKFAFYFFGIVLFFVFLSLLVRLGVLLKEGKFDNKYQFNVLIREKDKNKSRIISLNPGNFSLSDLYYEKSSDLAKLLSVPIDSSITSNSNIGSEDTSKLFFTLLLNYKNISTDLTIIDMLRIMFFIKRVGQKDVSKSVIKEDIDSLKASQIALSYFLDKQINEEKSSIKIINATTLNGLGGNFAKMLGNIGGNVIIVATSDKIEKESSISYFGEKDYTVGRLEKILRVKAKALEERSDADIIIVLGEDLKNFK